MRSYIYLFAIVCSCLACSKEPEEALKTGVYGIVLDESGTPLNAVDMTIEPVGGSTVTGADGSYSFTLSQKGIYSVYAGKDGYVSKERSVIVETGKQEKLDFLLESIPAVITATVDSLDFREYDDVRAFSIQNKYYKPLEWEIVASCPWITRVTPESGILVKDQTEAITVFIDRELLAEGKNETTLVVRSSTNGSAELKIIATGTITEQLTLSALEAYPQTTSAILNAEIVHAGKIAYSERGFVYHTAPMPTLENTIAKLPVPKDDNKRYSYHLKGLSLGESYYVRAYASYDGGNVYSSNEIYFTTAEALPVVITEGATDVEGGKATLRGKIVSVGDPAYIERGFVYGKNSDLSIDDGNKIPKEGSAKEGIYSIFMPDLPIPCYVRAYATNKLGTAYGETRKVESTEFIELKAAGIAVQLKDIGNNDWTSVNAMCKNSTVGGYTDWYLPDKEELMTLYTNSEIIGNFSTSLKYWSSSIFSTSYYYSIDFSNGNLATMYNSSSASARCVRKLAQ